MGPERLKTNTHRVAPYPASSARRQEARQASAAKENMPPPALPLQPPGTDLAEAHPLRTSQPASPSAAAAETAPESPARPKTPTSPPLTPTGRKLYDLTNDPDPLEAVPSRPGTPVRMTPHQAEAATQFKQNMEEADPNGRLRKRGEFFQAFRTEGGEVKANHPIHYEKGNEVKQTPPDAFPEGSFLAIHSHPPGYASDRPSPDDYFEAWKTKKQHGVPSEMMYEAGKDRFRIYEGEHPPKFRTAHPPREEGRTSPTPSDSSGSDSE